MAETVETLALGLDARQMKRGAREADTALGRVRKSARSTSRAIVQLAGAFTAAAVARSAVRTIIQFDDRIRELGAVAGAGEEQLRLLSRTARDLGASTRFAASEAAEGLTFLARAGFSVDEAIAAIPGTLNLASAGLLSLGEAADIASNAVSQFNLSAGETERVGDILVQTANNSNTSVRQLAEALKFVGPAANALRVPIEEAAAAIGALGNAGIQASLAGTNLRGIFAALVGPTSAGQRALAAMELTLEDIDVEARGLTEVFENLSRANLDFGRAVEIFGRRNATAALVLAANVETVRELNQLNREAEGTTRRVSEALEAGLGGALRTLRSTIEEVFLSLGKQGLEGGLEDLVRTSTSTIRILTGIATRADLANESAVRLAQAVELVSLAFRVWLVFMAARGLIVLAKTVVELGRLSKVLTTLSRRNVVGILLALGAGALVASGQLDTLLESVVQNAQAVDQYALKLEQLNDLREAFIRQTKLETAGRERGGDVGLFRQIQAVESQISILEQARVALERLGELTDGVTLEALEQALTPELFENFGEAAAMQFGEAYITTLERGLDAETFRKIWRESLMVPLFEEVRGLKDQLQSELITTAGSEFEDAATSIARGVSDPFTNAFSEISQGTRDVAASFSALATDIANTISRLVLSRALVNPLLNTAFGLGGSANALPSFFAFGANGLAMNNGTIIPKYARGGVVTQPTVIAGEAGAEAVLPLKRGRDGKLGVASEGGAGTTVNMTVVTNDAGSFRRSQRQIQRDMQRRIA